jgi:hypothetical protein
MACLINEVWEMAFSIIPATVLRLIMNFQIGANFYAKRWHNIPIFASFPKVDAKKQLMLKGLYGPVEQPI